MYGKCMANVWKESRHKPFPLSKHNMWTKSCTWCSGGWIEPSIWSFGIVEGSLVNTEAVNEEVWGDWGGEIAWERGGDGGIVWWGRWESLVEMMFNINR